MMPRDFPEKTHELGPPPSLSEEECGRLPVCTDGKQCVSCWTPSLRERLSILFFGRVWLCVMNGDETQPPVWLAGKRAIFRPETTEPPEPIKLDPDRPEAPYSETVHEAYPSTDPDDAPEPPSREPTTREREIFDAHKWIDRENGAGHYCERCSIPLAAAIANDVATCRETVR